MDRELGRFHPGQRWCSRVGNRRRGASPVDQSDQRGERVALGGHPVGREHERNQQQQPGGQEHVVRGVSEPVQDLRKEALRVSDACDDRRLEEADPDDDGLDECADRRDHVELVELHDRVLISQEYAAERGQPRGNGKRGQLDPAHIDSESRRRAFVAAHGEHPAPEAASSHVRDHDHRQPEHDHRHHGKARRMVDRAQAEAEDALRADRGAIDATQVAVVSEHDILERQSKP